MLLKKLEIFGFKSFAEKTTLEFEKGITAIVGPNGCGKSNIVDGMKWVLGEQSAKELRGGSMEDVIFNGTELAERVNFAEISLEISNEDGKLPIEFSDVTITRRLFRSGESEYLVNRVPVRLKDVQELIAGTGIGTKAYSLMEQGKMDLLLSSKPEERRFVFEEASGITRFKNKKKEATRKLEATENNLLRVADIIAEVRRQISSLERQARKAERYKVFYEELKDKEVKFAAFEIKGARENIKTHLSEKEKMQNYFESMKSLLQEQESRARVLRGSISSRSEEIAKEENHLREHSSKFQRNQERVEWNRNSILENNKKMLLLGDELREIKQRIETAVAKIEGAEREKLDLGREEESSKIQIEEKKNTIQSLETKSKNINKEIEELKSRIMEENFELTQKKNLLLQLDSEIKACKIRLERLHLDKEDAQVQLNEQETKISSISIKLSEIEEKLNEVSQKFESMLQNKKLLLENREIHIAERAGIERDITTFETRLSSWREIQSKGLSYSESLRLIQQKLPQNIMGLLSDLLKVVPENVTKVETSYRGHLEAVVVKDKDNAAILLDFCRREALSDVNIIILEQLKEPQIEKIAEAVSISELLNVEGEYKKLLSLAADIYYAKEITAAQELSSKYPRFKFLSESNILFQQGKICIGFNPSKDLGYLDREGKIARLDEKTVLLKDKLIKLNESIKNLDNNIAIAENDVAAVEKDKAALNYEVVNLKRSQEALEENKKRLLQEKEVIDLDIEEIKTELENNSSRGERLQHEVSDIQELLKEAEEGLLKAQAELSQALDLKHDISLQAAQLAAQGASIRQRHEQFQGWYNLANEELQNLSSDEQKRKQDYDDAVLKIFQFKEEISVLTEDNIALDKNLNDGESALGEKKLDYESLKSEFEKDEDALINMRNEYTGKKDEIHALDLGINEEEYKIKSIKDRLNQVYNIQDFPEAVKEGDDHTLIKQEIQELQDKVQKIGEVNLVAIEEHKQLQERLSFLENQEKDLLEAKESLATAIRKINKTTREMFSEAFQEVRKAFKEIFPRLFGGGDADLILDEGVDCLEAGIEILSRPPGKKLQSVGLLSGGEKALTALSLMFAIFKVKPSPFCILDEVDAPLDESNIDRYRRLLGEFASLSQFLVITHNKRTISTADVIYGITMENTGISKIVSVKFHKTEEATAN